MNKKHSHMNVHKLMVALLVGIVAVPITSTALFLQQDSLETMNSTAVDLRQNALEDRSRLRAQRRLYWQAVEQFQNLKEQGEDVSMPAFNDTATFEMLRSSAPEPIKTIVDTVTSLTTDQLESHDRALLRRYTRAGFCPESLTDFYIEGFYELCVSLVGSTKARTETVKGLLNHNAYIYRKMRRSAPHSDLSPWKLRMEMINQAHHGVRRDGGVRPGRPTKCIMNPDCLQPRYGY